jgi:hypothetical protein
VSQQSRPSTHQSFFGLNLNQVYVLRNDSSLWLESAPLWGKGTSPPQKIGPSFETQTFSPVFGTNQVLVLSQDSSLHLNTLGQDSQGPQVSGSALAFDGNVTLGLQQAYVLGQGADFGNLWLEQGPWGTVSTPPQQVDGNAAAFQTINANQVFVLGSDGKLWLETGPWEKVPPRRIEIGGGNIVDFQALGSVPGSEVFVLSSEGTLWLNTVGGGSSGPQVGGGRINFFQVAPTTNNEVFVLGEDHTLWLNTVGAGARAPQVDANVFAFHAIDSEHVYVQDLAGNLWLEHAPWGSVPPARQLVDVNLLALGTL